MVHEKRPSEEGPGEKIGESEGGGRSKKEERMVSEGSEEM
jgi:hypothetical protein